MAETTLLSLRPTRLIALHYYLASLVLWMFAGVLFLNPWNAFTNWRIPLLEWRVTSLGAALVALFGLLALLRAEIKRIGVKYIVTDSRVIRLDGILRRKTNQMPFNKVERVEMDQSLLQRVFKFGDIVLDTGEDTIVLGSLGHVNLVQNELSKIVAMYSKHG